MLDKIIEWFPEEDILKADGFDEAIIGIDTNEMRLIYSVSKCIQILCRDMNEEEAVEFFDFNIRGSYVGDKMVIRHLYGVLMIFKYIWIVIIVNSEVNLIM
jgi:hypothetical protein